MSELAEKAGVSLPAMTEIISKLEKRKLVKRHRDEKDRRRIYMELTEASLKLMNETLVGHFKLMKKFFKNFSIDEIKKMNLLLEEITELIKKS